jgi:hypothetical protein
MVNFRRIDAKKPSQSALSGWAAFSVLSVLDIPRHLVEIALDLLLLLSLRFLLLAGCFPALPFELLQFLELFSSLPGLFEQAFLVRVVDAYQDRLPGQTGSDAVSLHVQILQSCGRCRSGVVLAHRVRPSLSGERDKRGQRGLPFAISGCNFFSSRLP